PPGSPLAALVPAFGARGINLEFTKDPALEAWTKMMVVCSLTAGCALYRTPVGAVRSRRLGLRFLSKAASEVGRVGRARGVPITDDHEAHARDVLNGFPEDFVPSLIHDLTRGKPTEVAALNGAVSRMGQGCGIPTPIHDAATTAIEIWERGLKAL
ncbi:MAG: ketopantoate reductase family protein, partial [Longimicrobiales bacterium]